MSTLVLPESEEDVDLRTNDGDHDKFSHYAPKHLITDAMVFATPIRALCGKTWVPTRDGERFPVCPDCKYLYENVVQP